MGGKFRNWDTLILIGVFLVAMGALFMLSGGLAVGIVMLIVGAVLLLCRIIYIYSDKNKPHKKLKNKHENGIYLGILLLLIGVFMLIAQIGTTLSILLLISGGLLLLGTLIIAYVFDKEQTNTAKQELTTQEDNHLEDVTDLVYETSCNDYMDMLKNFAIDLGKEDNYNKYYDQLKNQIQNLQDSYGYAIKGQAKHITAIACYYLLDADRHVFLHTHKPTVLKYFWDIVELLENNLDDPLLEEDSELFIKDIVDGYFYWGKGNPHNNNNCTIRY